MILLRSKNYVVETVTCNKLALSNLDGSSIVCDSTIDALL